MDSVQCVRAAAHFGLAEKHFLRQNAYVNRVIYIVAATAVDAG
jgi:hypothetical protein